MKIEMDLYNSDIKDKFLNEIDNIDSRNVMYYSLRRATEAEYDKKKDLFDMNIDEIEDVMFAMSPSTATASLK